MRKTLLNFSRGLLTISFLTSPAYSAPLTADWKRFIAPEMLEQYAGKESDRFSEKRFEGDILNIDPDIGEEELHGTWKNVMDDEKTRWPKNTVPYELSVVFTPDELDTIKKAMDTISKLTYKCVRFVERTTETDYVRVQKGFNCNSNVGRTGGKQAITLNRGCLASAASGHLGDVQHEIMHTLGFYHEMNRLDRDDYVTINWDNIEDENKRQFKKNAGGTTFGLPYDYESVMHYPWNSFAIDNQLPTIIPKRPRQKIGQNKNLSTLDVAKLNQAYKCEIPDPDDLLEEAPEPEPVTTVKPRKRHKKTTTPAPIEDGGDESEGAEEETTTTVKQRKLRARKTTVIPRNEIQTSSDQRNVGPISGNTNWNNNNGNNWNNNNNNNNWNNNRNINNRNNIFSPWAMMGGGRTMMGGGRFGGFPSGGVVMFG